MSSDEKIILGYMTLLKHLRADLKLLLIAKLSESVRKDYSESSSESNNDWKQLFGAWSDMEEDIADTIRNSRVHNRTIPSFD